jgi:urocanate hydratase
MGGVARRNWAGNENAIEVARAYNQQNENGDQVTIPYPSCDLAVGKAVDRVFF